MEINGPRTLEYSAQRSIPNKNEHHIPPPPPTLIRKIPRPNLSRFKSGYGTHEVEDTIADTVDSADDAAGVFEVLARGDEGLEESG